MIVAPFASIFRDHFYFKSKKTIQNQRYVGILKWYFVLQEIFYVKICYTKICYIKI